jgi:hypothetical protein
MWLVYDWSDGLVGIFEHYSMAKKEYEAYVELNKRELDDEFYGDELVVLARVERQLFSYDTKKAVIKFDENGQEYKGDSTYWDWKEVINMDNNQLLDAINDWAIRNDISEETLNGMYVSELLEALEEGK